jgi:hypothetical protein
MQVREVNNHSLWEAAGRYLESPGAPEIPLSCYNVTVFLFLFHAGGGGAQPLTARESSGRHFQNTWCSLLHVFVTSTCLC